jgi:hypothetical protein
MEFIFAKTVDVVLENALEGGFSMKPVPHSQPVVGQA